MTYYAFRRKAKSLTTSYAVTTTPSAHGLPKLSTKEVALAPDPDWKPLEGFEAFEEYNGPTWFNASEVKFAIEMFGYWLEDVREAVVPPASESDEFLQELHRKREERGAGQGKSASRTT